jgi:hypothetical protein
VPLGARDAVAELTSLLGDTLGQRLLGLYLFGPLPAGGYQEGRSDVDLLAVLSVALGEDDLPALDALHSAFVARHPEWTEHVEVGYIGRDVLATFAGAPAGQIAAISPGEPLHLREPEYGWVLNWHSACTQGETLIGPPPLELGPEVTAEAFRHAIVARLEEWADVIREPWVRYVPAARGYAVVTHCRSLHSLVTGELASKEEAVAWVAERYPEHAAYVRRALADHRGDLETPQREAIAFADWVRAEALGG